MEWNGKSLTRRFPFQILFDALLVVPEYVFLKSLPEVFVVPERLLLAVEHLDLESSEEVFHDRVVMAVSHAIFLLRKKKRQIQSRDKPSVFTPNEATKWYYIRTASSRT